MGVAFTDTEPTEWGKSLRTITGTTNHGKFNLGKQPVFSSHRSGWGYAIDALLPLHNPHGIKFDGFLEDSFAWMYEWHKNTKTGVIPYTEPWVGFFHNPPNSPDWFFGHNSLDKIIKRPLFKKSLKKCLGLYTLSTTLAEYLRSKTKVPVNVVYHPTEIPETLFDFETYLSQKTKNVVCIGYWLRKLNSIYQLPLHSFSGFKKIRLIPYTAERPKETIDKLVEAERGEYDICVPDAYANNTHDMERLSDSEYDSLLSKSIVFLDLYDSSANNAVVECIARGTPIVINRIPSSEEYLGKDYPLFFNDLDHAKNLIRDESRILEAHNYLLESPMRKKLTKEYFCNSVINSDIYKSL